MKAYIKDIVYYLPEKVERNQNERLREKTGIECRHVAEENETAADMAVKAAEKLFEKVSRESVDYVLFCSQSPDYLLPTTACVLQDRLGLSKYCGALDYNHGCTGYIYGLGLAKGLIESGQAKSVLLLTAETYSKYIHPKDHAVLPLFGDAATATLIVAKDTEDDGIYGFEYGTDGAGFENLIVPVGGARQPYQLTEIKSTTDKYGNIRTNQNLFMNGGAIMDFALEVVPETLSKILSDNNLERKDINYYIFHQANHFMLKSLQKICRLGKFQYWNDVREYGNTVSNSIPIALVDMLKETKTDQLHRCLLMGFGVGLSWGGCIVDLTDC
ncbi:3-oxoacyl-(acyl-carrier-protein) synthase, KASIII [Anaerovibrio sp. JC8]|uniref:ketoacyl-ACP synthase III n=1 Tax=Anaerovibrio sp. JC8 TaxID=1240085 RepID=UPI000A0B7AFA|nr:ketoacyl-ACP synthase III [Anaerovibrio sp. JC8]ORU01363.1 3-oxoacyl-(acyl-carrier-protein) synthase, KASIII [Anaerovibrio sp. JC8]